MAVPNPTIDPPRLASTAARSLHSRSPSRSPVRQQDPFLRALSPTKTLRAFSSRPTDSRSDALTKSIHDATHSQRAHGAKVAQACADLRSWTRELESWQWPNTFDVPESAQGKQRMSAMTLLSRTESMEHEQDRAGEDEYWGSLPAKTVESYEMRLEEIYGDFDTIELEELKSFVLSAHSQAGVGEASIEDSIGAIGAATDLKRLDDFTALITATILQALPYLPRLTRLLETWTTRLAILRSAPQYLRDLQKARTDLDHGWGALAISAINQSPHAHLTAASLEEMKSVISAQVYSLGKRLDRFLDMLEGRAEVVPDAWIDDFEELESEYGDWVVKAERKVLEGEWQAMKVQVRDTVRKMAREEKEDQIKEVGEMDEDGGILDVTNASADATTRGLPMDVKQAPMIHVGPANGDEEATRTNAITPWDDLGLGAATSGGRAVSPEPKKSTSSSRNENDSPARRRHVPIVIPYTHPDEPVGNEGTASADVSRSNSTTNDITLTRTRSKTPSENVAAGTSVKQRAAFLNNDIEKGESLIKSKSAPIVRPFEHASNAFTRLFKRENSPASSESGRGKHVANVEESSRPSAGYESSSQRSGVASSGSGSGKASSSSFTTSSKKNQRLEYMDMVRAPSEPSKSMEKSRGRDKNGTDKREKGARMAYGDLVMAMPPSSSRDTRTARKSEEAKRTMPVTPEDKVLQRSEEAKKLALTNGLKSNVTMSGFENSTITHITGGVSQRRSLDDITRPISKSSQDSEVLEPMPAPVRLYEDCRPIAKPITVSTPETYKPEMRSVSSNKGSLISMYRPSGLLVPFHASPQTEQDEFPPDWPLSASATPSDNAAPEKDYFADRAQSLHKNRTSDEPIQTDAFEELFVHSLPPHDDMKETIQPRKVTHRDPEPDTIDVRPSSAPGFRTTEQQSIVERSSLKSAGGGNLRRSDFMTPHLYRPVSIVKEEDFSQTEGVDETLVRNQSGCFDQESLKGSTSTPHISQSLQMPSDLETILGTVDIESSKETDPKIKRASVASVESHSRDEVKSIELSRGSVEGSVEGTTRPQTPKARDSTEAEANSPLRYKDVIVFPSPPRTVPARGSSLRGSISSMTPDSPLKQASASSPLIRNQEEDAPLNILTPKQRKPKRNSSGSIGESVGSPRGKKPAQHSNADNFDRHVSEVLDRVHAPIRFRTRPGSVTPVAKASVDQKAKSKTERQGKDMTLAPADSSWNKASATDPEVKLYHLTQAGRAEPIKLYVRLVGEGERVMVRVGGGWADLADYLRQYAEHHGSRTVSDPVLELQTASAPGSANGTGSGKRTVSGPAFAPESKIRTPVSPTTGRYTASPVDQYDSWTTGRSNNRPRIWLGDDSGDDEEEQQSPTLPKLPWQETWRSRMSNSRPNTADSTTRPDSRHGLDGNSPIGPGLDGKLKTELPEQKARWVEGMIEKARKSANAASVGANAEKDKEKSFGDMGKVGGTRRVVFRSASGADAAK